MTRGTAYLLIAAFGAVMAFGLVAPLVGEIAASIEQSAAIIQGASR